MKKKLNLNGNSSGEGGGFNFLGPAGEFRPGMVRKTTGASLGYRASGWKTELLTFKYQWNPYIRLSCFECCLWFGKMMRTERFWIRAEDHRVGFSRERSSTAPCRVQRSKPSNYNRTYTSLYSCSTLNDCDSAAGSHVFLVQFVTTHNVLYAAEAEKKHPSILYFLIPTQSTRKGYPSWHWVKAG